MTDTQAKNLTIARLHTIREHALELILVHLLVTLSEVAGKYLLMTGNLSTKKTARTLQVELRKLLVEENFDPTTLKVAKTNEARAMVTYKNLHLHDYVRWHR